MLKSPFFGQISETPMDRALQRFLALITTIYRLKVPITTKSPYYYYLRVYCYLIVYIYCYYNHVGKKSVNTTIC